MAAHTTVRARLRLMSTGEGGRSAPISSGYRSLVRFDGAEDDFGYQLVLDSSSLAPGETGTGALSFWAAESLPSLADGHAFEMREGTRVIGTGEVLAPEMPAGN